MISEEGRVHEPTFTFRVWIDGVLPVIWKNQKTVNSDWFFCVDSSHSETNLSAIATGLSKKKAKQSAALKALESLAEDDEEIALELAGLEGINPQYVPSNSRERDEYFYSSL